MGEPKLIKEFNLLDELMQLRGKPLGKYEWRIKVLPRSVAKMGGWVSGIPYAYSAFKNRAYVFGSRAQASRIAKLLGRRYRLIKTEVHSG